MKKLIILITGIIFILILAVSVSASFGVIVEAQKTDKQPNLEHIDSSWGNPVISGITSESENVYMWQFYATDYEDKAMGDGIGHMGTGPEGRPSWLPEDSPIDLYMLWDEQYFYFAFKTKDYDIKGYASAQRGDGAHLWLQPANTVTDPTVGATTFTEHITYNPYLYVWSLDFDDWSTGLLVREPGAVVNATQELEIPPIINVDPGVVGDDGLEGIIAIPWKNLYPKKSVREESLVDGTELAIAFLRVSSTTKTCLSLQDRAIKDDNGITGGIVWGKYLQDNPPNQKYKKPTNTSLNTVILRDPSSSSSGDTDETSQQIDSGTTNRPDISGVSSWALTEVEAAIDAGLVPEYIQKDWTSPITRGQVSEMFIRLLEKATGKKVGDIIAQSGAVIESGKFEDTEDENVYAANALGIINGTSSTKFSPGGTLKRAQIAALINRVAKVVGVETAGYTHSFEDITDNYSWVNAELGWPSSAGIINGVSSSRFNPGGDLTTEQAILITYRALGALKNDK